MTREREAGRGKGGGGGGGMIQSVPFLPDMSPPASLSQNSSS